MLSLCPLWCIICCFFTVKKNFRDIYLIFMYFAFSGETMIRILQIFAVFNLSIKVS